MRNFPATPTTVPCLKTVRTDSGKGYRTGLEEGQLAAILQRTKDEQRAVTIESRRRQAISNPLAEQWKEDTPEIQSYYDTVEEDAANLERYRKDRND